MGPRLLSVSSLLVGAGFLFVAHGGLGIVVPLRGDLEGFSRTTIGLIGTGWALGYTLGCVLVPFVVRRVGHVRTFGAVAAMCAVAALSKSLFIGEVYWMLLRAVGGFSTAGAYMIMESWLNERSTNETRGAIFSIYVMVSTTAILSGQLLVIWIDLASFVPFAVFAIFYAFALMPTALSRARTPEPLQRVSFDLLKVYRNSPVAFVACILIGMTNSAYLTFAPLYGKDIGLSITIISVMLGTSMLGGMITQWPIGRLSDRFDRRWVMAAVGGAAAAVGIAVWLLDPSDPIVVLALMVAFGGLAYPLYSVAIAHANDYAEAEEFVSLAGGLLLLYGLGTIFGPLSAAYVMETFGPTALFGFTAMLHGAVGSYAAYRVYRRDAPAEADAVDFQSMPLPRTHTLETIVFDPRTDEDENEPPAEPTS